MSRLGLNQKGSVSEELAHTTCRSKMNVINSMLYLYKSQLSTHVFSGVVGRREREYGMEIKTAQLPPAPLFPSPLRESLWTRRHRRGSAEVFSR
jgi:hypothetical protein